MYLSLNTRYNPFTYDELIKPLMDYKKAYDEVEAAYSNLSQQTEAFKDEVNKANSPDAYTMYKQYSDALNEVVDDFSKGMTATNRAKLLTMKKDYAKNIVPIAKASEARKEANALRDKLGPDAIFEVNRYTSLDDFLGGKIANNRYQSASAITKKTAAIAEAAMKEALQDPEFIKVLGNQQYMLTQHTGGSYEDLVAAIANNPAAQNRFAEIKRQIMDEVGYNNYDMYGKAAIESAVNTGLYAGLDKPIRQFEANKDYKSADLQEEIRQFNIGLKMRGYNDKGNVDPDNPYWKTQGLEYDKENKTWKVIGKPGTNKPGTSGSNGSASNTDKGRVPVYNKTISIRRDGTRTELSEGEAIKGKRVNIVPDKGSYSIKIGNLLLGAYNPETYKFTSKIDKSKRKSEEIVDILGHSYDNEVDDVNVQHLLEEITNIVSKSGEASLNNYNFYIELDNDDSSSDDGGVYIEPLYRGMATSFDNEDDFVDLELK